MELSPIAPLPQADSVEVTLLLRFENKRPAQVTGQHTHLSTLNYASESNITAFCRAQQSISHRRAKYCFNAAKTRFTASQVVDFRMVYTSGNLLGRLLGGCGTCCLR